jgi:hypothetical protein
MEAGWGADLHVLGRGEGEEGPADELVPLVVGVPCARPATVSGNK